jgi:hypothetical protein
MWAQLFQHSMASAKPVWSALGRARFSHWSWDFAWRRPAERNQLFRRARESACQKLARLEREMTDSLVVAAAIAAVILAGLFVGRQSGSIWPHPVWLGIFAICGVAAISLGKRLVRLRRELSQWRTATNGGFAAAPDLSTLGKKNRELPV